MQISGNYLLRWAVPYRAARGNISIPVATWRPVVRRMLCTGWISSTWNVCLMLFRLAVGSTFTEVDMFWAKKMNFYFVKRENAFCSLCYTCWVSQFHNQTENQVGTFKLCYEFELGFIEQRLADHLKVGLVLRKSELILVWRLQVR
jgi:hypothetical protein